MKNAGTMWTIDGQGEESKDLAAAIGISLAKEKSKKTNLKLTGHILTHYDVQRIRYTLNLR